ncbi:hypothetical protein KEM56_000519, partial [Ascosphaera pollenicola]
PKSEARLSVPQNVNNNNPASRHAGANPASRTQNNAVAGFPGIGSLASLHHEEAMLCRRKDAIAAFGYYWIRPAGCSKTLLAVREEAAEREAVERANFLPPDITEPPQPVFDMQGPMQFDMGIDDGDIAAEDGEDDAAHDHMGMERDLDDDIPELDAGDYSDEGDGDDDDDDDDDGGGGIYEDEDGDEDENQEPAQEGTGLFERDLDEDIPNADEGFSQSHLEAFTNLNGEDSTIHEDETFASAQLDNSLLNQGLAHAERDLDDDIPDASASDRSDQESDNADPNSEADVSQQETTAQPSYLDADNTFSHPVNPLDTATPLPAGASPFRLSPRRSASRDLFQSRPTLLPSPPRPCVPPYNPDLTRDITMDTTHEDVTANPEPEVNIEQCLNINMRRPRGVRGQDTPIRSHDTPENSGRPSTFTTPLNAVTPSETPGTGITLRRAAARRAAQQTRAQLGLQDAVSIRSRRRPRPASPGPDANPHSAASPDPATLQTPAHNPTTNAEIIRQGVAPTPANDVPPSAGTRSRSRSQAHLVTPDIANIPIAPNAPARKGTRRLRGRR